MEEHQYQEIYSQWLKKLSKYAEENLLEIVISPPLTDSDIDEIPRKIKPHFGNFHYKIPKSYRSFLKTCGGLQVFDQDGYLLLGILDVKNVIKDTYDLVHVPDEFFMESYSSGGGKEVKVTTNHLVAFAHADEEARYCFYTDTKGEELRVYYHHQDEITLAKTVLANEWLDEEFAEEPEASSFYEWIKKSLEEIIDSSL